MTYEDVKTESGADHGLLTPNNIYTPQRLDLKGNPGRSKFEYFEKYGNLKVIKNEENSTIDDPVSKHERSFSNGGNNTLALQTQNLSF